MLLLALGKRRTTQRASAKRARAKHRPGDRPRLHKAAVFVSKNQYASITMSLRSIWDIQLCPLFSQAVRELPAALKKSLLWIVLELEVKLNDVVVMLFGLPSGNKKCEHQVTSEHLFEDTYEDSGGSNPKASAPLPCMHYSTGRHTRCKRINYA